MSSALDDRSGVRIFPPWIYLGGLFLGFLLHWRLPLPIVPPVLVGPLRLLGAFCLVAGLALDIWAVATFRRAGTSPHPAGPTTALAVGGPYRFTRNPMYLGLVFITAALALLANALWPLVLLPVVIYQPTAPQVLRTNITFPGFGFVGVPFLGFNGNVFESGARAFWNLHAAYFYKGLSVVGEWQQGFQDYATFANPVQPGLRTRLPVGGWYVEAGYFLTGETVAGRGFVKPIRNFDPRPGRFGLGAIELTGRYSHLGLGDEVFRDGLADRGLWTNDAGLIDVGFNWYWNRFVKVYFTWQHAMFADPVFLEPPGRAPNNVRGRFQATNDMLWVRWQLNF